MKDGRDKVSMNLNLLTEKTAFEKFEENLKSSIFAVLFVLLKNQDFSLWVEIIFVLVQLLQFMSFPFSKIDNAEMYVITFYLALCLVVLVIMNIFYVSISFSKNKFNVVWPLKILRGLISFLATIMFLPILDIFLSIFKCIAPPTYNPSAKLLKRLQFVNSTLSNFTNQILNETYTNTITTSTNTVMQSEVPGAIITSATSTAAKVNLYANSIECWAGTFYIHAIFSILVSVFFVIVCIIIQMTFFETKSSTHNHSAKANSKSDVFMLISKVLTLILFEFFEETNNQWVLITVIFFLSAFTFFTYFEEMPYYNDRIMKVYLIATSIYFWNTSCLLLGKVLENTSFDGLLPLFFIGIPIITIIIITLPDNQMILLFTSLNKFQKGEKVQKQIKYYLELVDKREFDRDSKILLQGYISIYEETCNIQDCSLKKYIYNLENLNMETNAFLLQHAETLFQTGISKFPNCTALRISYAFFLLERLNKKQQANIELINAEKYLPKFEEQFIIYRYKKILEEQSGEVGDSEENLDIVSNIAYKNHLFQFKNAITKVATLYLDFWGLLLNPNQDNQEDLSKLNDYGSKINSVVEEINTHFEKMQKIKHNDQEVIKIYSDFLADILNDKDKAFLYQSRLNEMEGNKFSYDDANLVNVDMNILSQSDEYQYIVISAQPEKLGIITNISLGVCTLFGYSKTELIGKNIEFLMPEVYQKHHRNLLLSKINDYRKNTMTAQQLAKNFKPIFKEVFSFGKNKSRYLVPINIKVAFVPNEEKNDSNFVAKLVPDNFNSGIGQMTQTCCVLVNNNFIIQNFTANSVSMLGLNSNSINNGTMEILKFIKEFQDEYAKIDFDDKSPEQLVNMKRNIVANRFKYIQPVTWRQYENVKNKNSNMSELVSNVGSFCKSDVLSRDASSHNVSKTNSKYNRQYKAEHHLNLTVTELIIQGRHEGFIFKFDSMSSDNPILLQFLANRSCESSTLTGAGKKSNPGSTTIVNNYPEQEINMKIDKTFVPESQNMFMLDAKKMSYVMNPKNPKEIKENIKVEAAKKLKREKTISEKDSSMLSASEESDNEEEENSEDSVESGVEHKNSQNNRQKKNEDYYQVNLTNIKFLVYDMKKDSLVESHDQQKVSQVELRKNEDYEKNSEELSVKEVSVTKKEVVETIEEDAIENNKEAVLIKQIEFALNKTENQPTITRMKWISFFIFSSIVTLTSLFFFLFLNSVNLLNENIKLIYDSYNLISNTVYSIYHTRELILLNNPKYTNFYQKREDYIQNNTNILLNMFAESHDLLTDVITTNMPISDANKDILSNSKMKIFILEDNLGLKSIDLTLSASFLETNTALYHVANQQISGIYPTAKDVFFFMYNSINSIYDKLFLHASIFIEELTNNINGFKYNFLIIFIAASSFSIASYFAIAFAFVEVGKRKESYLEVFFEIGEGVIKNSLEKCEKFSKKFQSDNMSEDVSNLDETDMILDPVMLTLGNGKSNRSSGSKKRKSNNSREDKIIKIKIFIGLFFISLFFLIIYIIYQRYLEAIKTYVMIYNNMAVEQAFYLMIFNSLREYFFDKKGYIFTQPASDFIENSIDDIYKFKRDRENFTFYNKENFPTDYSTLYDDIMNQNICKYAENIFNEYLNDLNLECSSFVSNSSSFGLNILLTHYFEDIRISKFNFDLMLEDLKNSGLDYYFNNTLYRTKYDKSKGIGFNNKNQTLNLSEFDPIEIFNDNTVRNLGLVNRFLIKPAYTTLKMKLESTIDQNINTFEVVYIVTLSLFLGGIFILYVFVWRPFENSLNTTIYKTKNMLSIIPKEVLANLGNIHRLLGIGQNLSKPHGKKAIIAKKIIKQEEHPQQQQMNK